MTLLLDDHLLRDWLVGPDRAFARALADGGVATTNLWYARLTKSAARVAGRGALLGHLRAAERRVLVAALVRLPDDVTVVPMRDLAWPMGELVGEFNGLSTLGAEVLASAEMLGPGILAFSRDVSPGIRPACAALGLSCQIVAR